jgi:hypothetical protein
VTEAFRHGRRHGLGLGAGVAAEAEGLHHHQVDRLQRLAGVGREIATGDAPVRNDRYALFRRQRGHRAHHVGAFAFIGNHDQGARAFAA